MGAISKKLRSVEGGRLMFWCPGCDGAHQVGVGDGPGPRWGYNGNPDTPTFTPSILVTGIKPLTDDDAERLLMGDVSIPDEPEKTICHSFVKDGRIQFLSDCSHGLAGQTVDIPDFDHG
ncbi:ammonia monooxygenase [Neorhizobium sp. T786]|uniref:DUF6527 family protein n=1 Tax=Pseudorhizobium xiangyangii TaxID=2883104 RepID=UPI001CFFC59F|nr:DUF6527 family protein [Neorhizobium xiangyangii]MCB5201732.1 ammonia monooxygenase [Neorhizobium xiangyangii]